jgi:hypothetical protein
MIGRLLLLVAAGATRTTDAFVVPSATPQSYYYNTPAAAYSKSAFVQDAGRVSYRNAADAATKIRSSRFYSEPRPTIDNGDAEADDGDKKNATSASATDSNDDDADANSTNTEATAIPPPRTVSVVEEDDDSSGDTTKEDAMPPRGDGDDDSVVDALRSVFDADTVHISFLQALGAVTGRGEFATRAQKKAGLEVAEKLEKSATHHHHHPDAKKKSNSNNAEHHASLLQGTWELLFTDAQLFRSSPFFMAGRAVCETDLQAKRFNWFCDMHRQALSISQINAVRQVISDTRLVSEIEVSAGAIPFLRDLTPLSYSGGLPVAITGALVSSADVTVTKRGDLELYMDTVEVKGSNIPGLRQLLDSGLKLRSRSLANFLEQTVSGYSTPKPLFRSTFLTDKYRISRDQDDNVFVYVKTSDSTEPKDYKSVDPDLGVGKLLEGFNDAVTRFYL